jgi:L-fucose/D-arabinose isomerase
MRVESIDMSEIAGRMRRAYDPRSIRKALAWVKANCKEGKDYNSPKRPAAASNSTASGRTA